MNPEYIIVQAGGRGSRMKELTENKPKALVPIGNRPMLFHLFEKFPDKRFIIITDYKSDVMRKYIAVFATVKYLIIDSKGKKGTCSGIKSALNKIPDNSPFMLIWSDLVLPEEFSFPEETDDYVGLSKGFTCRWKYENNLFEEQLSEKYGVAGLFIFKNKDKLSEVPEEGELVRWFQQKRYKFNTLSLNSVKEYGLIEEYRKISGQVIENRCRPFNKMTVERDLIIKEGIDEQGRQLGIKEKEWYTFVQKKGYDRIPEVYSYEPLTMKRINGKNVFEYKLSIERKKNILRQIVDCLRELHELDTSQSDYFSIYEAYVGKTFKRLEKIQDMIPFADQKRININGRICRNIYFYKDELVKRFEEYKCDCFKFLHGDNTFSNILLDENMKPVLIDPRGYFGYTKFYGDPAYDWAKLYYSIAGNYDKFNLKQFKLTINHSSIELHIESNGWEDIEDYFLSLIEDEIDKDTIKLIHAVIWLSLTTYAWEDYDSICGAFYNGLYYLEEVL